ncbi:MAG TPA: hypothetical protein VFV61_01810, partial [Pyrinomonadaceae bacterium]|nr:hypothetical protein [Pyrinomonadaceae bacterium]
MKTRSFCAILLLLSLSLMIACMQAPLTNQPNGDAPVSTAAEAAALKPALDSILANDIMQHTKVLSSDEYEGRGPGTKGEELSVKYITEQYQRLGLKPGNPDGTYVQKVPLAGFTAQPTASFSAGGKKIDLEFPKDYVAVSRRFVPESKVENSDIVFVGYGVVAPEYGWDDYKGVDVRGKTIVMLINDPAVPDTTDATKLDPKMFKGNAMTYYGRWDYKVAEAVRRGAAGVLVVHETKAAGYPWDVPRNGATKPQFDLR